MVEFEYNYLVLLTLSHASKFPHVYGYIVEYLFMEFNRICSSLPALIKWQPETLTMTLRAVRFHETVCRSNMFRKWIARASLLNKAHCFYSNVMPSRPLNGPGLDERRSEPGRALNPRPTVAHSLEPRHVIPSHPYSHRPQLSLRKKNTETVELYLYCSI